MRTSSDKSIVKTHTYVQILISSLFDLKFWIVEKQGFSWLRNCFYFLLFIIDTVLIYLSMVLQILLRKMKILTYL